MRNLSVYSACEKMIRLYSERRFAFKFVAFALIFIMSLGAISQGLLHGSWTIHQATKSAMNSSSNAPGTAVANITVGNYPTSIVYDSWNGYVYVSNIDNTISVIDTSTDQVVQSIPVNIFQGEIGAIIGRSLMAFDSRDNKIFVTSGLCNCVLPKIIPIYVINATTNKVIDTINFDAPLTSLFVGSLSSAGKLLYDSVNGLLYFFSKICDSSTGCSVVVIDPSTDQILKTLSFSLTLNDAAFDTTTGDIYGTSSLGLFSFSVSQNRYVSNSSLGLTFVDNLQAITFDPASGHVFIGGEGDIIEVDPGTYQILSDIQVYYPSVTVPTLDPQVVQGLVYDQFDGLVYTTHADSNVLHAVDPIKSAVVQNITIYGIGDSMVYDSSNGQLYASNAQKEILFNGIPPSSTHVTANTVSAIYVGGPAKGNLEIESYYYARATSEILNALSQQPSFPTVANHAYAGQTFDVILQVKNTGSAPIQSPSNLLAVAESPALDSLGAAPTMTSSLVGSPILLNPDEVTPLVYKVAFSWNFASSSGKLVGRLPILDSYSPMVSLDIDIQNVLGQSGLGWYLQFALHNAGQFSQTISWACPAEVSNRINAPTNGDLNTAAYAVENGFAAGDLTLAVNYRIGFAGYTTTYASPSGSADIIVLMPPGKLVLLDCLMLYYLDNASIFGSAWTPGSPTQLSTIYGIAQFLDDLAQATTTLEEVQAAMGLFVPDWMAVADALFQLGTESLLVSGISDPSGNYSSIVPPPISPVFLSNVTNPNNHLIMQSLYFTYQYLNASIESNARANLAISTNSLKYATLQTEAARDYANQSLNYLQTAIPAMEETMNLPEFTKWFNQTTLQKAQSTPLQISNDTKMILSEFGLTPYFNQTAIQAELSSQKNFTPFNATRLEGLASVPNALFVFDKSELSIIEESNNTQTRATSADFVISSTSPAPSGIGEPANAMITVTSINGFNGTVALSYAAPATLNCEPIAPSIIGPTQNAILTCDSSVAGNFNVVISGTSNSTTHFANVTFTVTAARSNFPNVPWYLFGVAILVAAGVVVMLVTLQRRRNQVRRDDLERSHNLS